nr:MAG TPA: hypothetical protein [Crassvirales sp.]
MLVLSLVLVRAFIFYWSSGRYDRHVLLPPTGVFQIRRYVNRLKNNRLTVRLKMAVTADTEHPRRRHRALYHYSSLSTSLLLRTSIKN